MPQLIMQRPELASMQSLTPVEQPGLYIAIISLFLVLFVLALLFKNL